MYFVPHWYYKLTVICCIWNYSQRQISRKRGLRLDSCLEIQATIKAMPDCCNYTIMDQSCPASLLENLSSSTPEFNILMLLNILIKWITCLRLRLEESCRDEDLQGHVVGTYPSNVPSTHSKYMIKSKGGAHELVWRQHISFCNTCDFHSQTY